MIRRLLDRSRLFAPSARPGCDRRLSLRDAEEDSIRRLRRPARRRTSAGGLRRLFKRGDTDPPEADCACREATRGPCAAPPDRPAPAGAFGNSLGRQPSLFHISRPVGTPGNCHGLQAVVAGPIPMAKAPAGAFDACFNRPSGCFPGPHNRESPDGAKGTALSQLRTARPEMCRTTMATPREPKPPATP